MCCVGDVGRSYFRNQYRRADRIAAPLREPKFADARAGRGTEEGSRSPPGNSYRLMFINSVSIWSAVVMTRELA